MRAITILCIAATVFTAGLLLGLAAPETEAADCFYICSCPSTSPPGECCVPIPQRCCISSTGLKCTPDYQAPVACPDIMCP